MNHRSGFSALGRLFERVAMDYGGVSTPLGADTSTTTFSDESAIDDSSTKAEFFSPKHDSSFWKRRRRSYINNYDSKSIQRIREIRKALGRVEIESKPYLDFRLRFAEDMAINSLILASRKRLSKSISASPSMLFGPCESEGLVSAKKQREEVVNDLNQRCLLCLFERAASEVERFIMCEEATPPLVQTKFSNRYADVHYDGSSTDLDLMDHTLVNGSSLVKLYSVIRELCRTNDGIIYKARHRLTGVVYCIKRSVRRSSVGRSEDSLSNALNESQALSVLRHTNIVRFYNSWVEAGSLLTQLEYCLGGSLFDCLNEVALTHNAPSVALNADSDDDASAGYQVQGFNSHRSALSSPSAATLTKLLSDIARALDYLHTKWCMAHKKVGLKTILVQLKPQAARKAYRSDEKMNDARRRCCELLLSGETNGLDFKLSDFGGASRVSEQEDVRDSDVYALGVTVCLTARGVGLSPADNELNEVYPSSVCASLQPILQLMLKPLAVDRVTASDVLEYIAASSNGSGVGTELMDV
ncbi:Wee1-like protein kinase [Echinococcus granulosus]|nr:Wee1-like protein kinase [Echinococcus granulosus]